MKQTHLNHANPWVVLDLNIRYAFQQYFVSYMIFNTPFLLVAFTIDVSDTVKHMLGYTTIIVWFGYGLIKTKQKGFVLLIGVGLLGSQWAFFNNQHRLDGFLTLVSLMLIIVKQYQQRVYFAILIDIDIQTNAMGRNHLSQ